VRRRGRRRASSGVGAQPLSPYPADGRGRSDTADVLTGPDGWQPASPAPRCGSGRMHLDDTPSAIGMLGDIVGQRIMSDEVCPGRWLLAQAPKQRHASSRESSERPAIDLSPPPSSLLTQSYQRSWSNQTPFGEAGESQFRSRAPLWRVAHATVHANPLYPHLLH
jgi:hypothetical protein